MSSLIDVLPSVVTDHKLQKRWKNKKNLENIKKRGNNKKKYKIFFTSVVRTRPINYGRVGLDALKMPSVAHVG